MKLQSITRIIPQLVGEGALDYDLKEDGLLVVIDAQGRKVCFTPAQFEPLLKEARLARAAATASAGTNEKAAKKGRRA